MMTGNGVRQANGHAGGNANKKRQAVPPAADVTRLASSTASST
jgi:hypothetical protein